MMAFDGRLLMCYMTAVKRYIWRFIFLEGEKNIAKNRERTPLKEIFELAKDTEDWVKPEYLAAV